MKPSWPSSPALSAVRSSPSGSRVLLGDRVLAHLDQHEMARAAVGGGEPDEALALLGAPASRAGRHDRLPAANRLVAAASSSACALASSSVRRDLARAAARGPCRRRGPRSARRSRARTKRSRSCGSAHAISTRLPGRVAHAVGRGQHAPAHADVQLARRALGLAGAARPVRGPSASLVVGDLDAARLRGGHAPHDGRHGTAMRRFLPMVVSDCLTTLVSDCQTM